MLENLQEYIEFKEKFEFVSPDIIEKDGIQYCNDRPIYAETGKFIAECDCWINVGYKIKGSLSKLLSNLYPYEFKFRGFQLKSIESFFQGLKFKDPAIQRMVFEYSGVDAYHIQAASDYNWKESGHLYWQGLEVNRYEEEYDLLVDEMYMAAAQNPLYRQALKNADKLLIHSVGKLSKSETVLTRYEFEKTINCLSSFFKQTDK